MAVYWIREFLVGCQKNSLQLRVCMVHVNVLKILIESLIIVVEFSVGSCTLSGTSV
jgi:hypothetical protein